MKNYLCKVISNTQLNEQTYNLLLQTPFEFNIECGQFVNVYIPGYLLGRPFSFESFQNNELSIIYKVNGQGTKELTQIQPNQEIKILGELGHGFDTNVTNEKIVIIGAGVGLPPMLNLYNKLKQTNNVTLIAAFTNESDTFRLEQITQDDKNVVLVQNSKKYLNLNPLQYLENKELDFDYIYACGPSILLKLLDQKYAPTKKGQISIEERMGCGHGTCYGCSKKTKKGKNVLTCKNGPVFDLGVLAWAD